MCVGGMGEVFVCMCVYAQDMVRGEREFWREFWKSLRVGVRT